MNIPFQRLPSPRYLIFGKTSLCEMEEADAGVRVDLILNKPEFMNFFSVLAMLRVHGCKPHTPRLALEKDAP